MRMLKRLVMWLAPFALESISCVGARAEPAVTRKARPNRSNPLRTVCRVALLAK